MQSENLGGILSDAHAATSQFADRAFSDYSPYARYYWIDTKTVPNRDVRAAMLVALNRVAIRQNAGGAYIGDFADGALMPTIGQDYAPTGVWETMFGRQIPDTGDPDLARSLIAQSGVKNPKIMWAWIASPTAI